MSTLPAGRSGTVRVKVLLAAAAGPGPVSGQVTAAGSITEPIPTAVVPVQPG